MLPLQSQPAHSKRDLGREVQRRRLRAGALGGERAGRTGVRAGARCSGFAPARALGFRRLAQSGLGAPRPRRRGRCRRHVSSLGQPLEPGVLCLNGLHGDSRAVGRLLRLRGEQVQYELHV